MAPPKHPLDPISPPAASGAPHRGGEEADELSRSPLLVLFGLIVVWGSLYLVAIAQNISYAPPPATQAAAASMALSPPAQPPLREISAGESMLAHVDSLHLREIPARQIVKDLLYKAHLHIEPNELEKVGLATRELKIQDRPLYECLYAAMHSDEMGISVVEDRVRFIEHQVTHQYPDVGPLEQYHWEADVELSGRPTAFFPSGRTTLWLRLRLIENPEAAEGRRRVAFEIYRSARGEASGEGVLPPPGSGAIRFVTGESVSLRIEDRSGPDDAGAQPGSSGRLNVRLQVRSPSAVGPALPEPPESPESIEPTETEVPVDPA